MSNNTSNKNSITSGKNSEQDIFGDEIKNKFGTDTSKDVDFASMFESSVTSVSKKLKTGDSYTAEILSIGKEEAFVTTPSHQDAMILTSELLDEAKNLKYKVGDRLDVVVIAFKNGEVRVAKAGSKKANADLDSLEDAFDMELPVEGRVTEVCNGGVRVQVQNKTAFCPISQLDYRVTDASSYINKKFDFLITQFDPKGRNLVVSRRKVLDLMKAESEGAFMSEKKKGDLVSGTVTRMEKYGAFIQLENGLEGLCHISEIGWSRLQDPSEVLTLGQKVQAMILEIVEVEGRLKISLSIKQAGGEGDPWLSVPEKFKLGTIHKGTVEKKEQYGLFVQIAPGVTGLLPRSKWRDHVDASGFENKKKGDQVDVQIDEILFEQKRISLGLPNAQEDQTWREHTGTAKATGFSTNKFGDLANMLKKK